ncbi:MAG: hypothetical protein UY76_C0065G0004 [Candidatus Uhrbacteria bacterium GW2011_GWA2_52_8d]|uniref:Uncharacterized protein n=1 Tax=Candidatus Uhrbacteria bacterium GW2011_GWA2_52_8d TaxID=1618979 RepID=A0A0G1XJQ3_9BACT|nr:MAG: hypothetical protein UY76_C0065G0004 [Candidatus Uhrbacteria bacterium GW2011_GWA2_52_8d]
MVADPGVTSPGIWNLESPSAKLRMVDSQSLRSFHGSSKIDKLWNQHTWIFTLTITVASHLNSC